MDASRYFYLQHNSHDQKADDDDSALPGLKLGQSFISLDRKGPQFVMGRFGRKHFDGNKQVVGSRMNT